MNPPWTLTARGAWPGAVVLRSGWSKARARPFNDDVPDASLRLERGSTAFLRRCSDWLLERAPVVFSGPLHQGSRRPWIDAGFQIDRTLALMERPLATPIEAPVTDVRPGRADEWVQAAELDRAAFDPDWRIGRAGLSEAASATPVSRFLVSSDGERMCGYAIAGVGFHLGYLQRVAVDPEVQGRGHGRSLVRASMAWARQRGARTMLLNTQHDNHGAAALYHSEGFEELPEFLTIMRREERP
jgi:ribosomal-protein-alanine N-acetyltransferase